MGDVICDFSSTIPVDHISLERLQSDSFNFDENVTILENDAKMSSTDKRMSVIDPDVNVDQMERSKSESLKLETTYLEDSQLESDRLSNFLNDESPVREGTLLKLDDSNSPVNPQFVCPTCGKYFPRYNNLRWHLDTHRLSCDHLGNNSQVLDLALLCEVCEQSFCSASALRKHKHQHNRFGRMPCMECNKMLRNATQLKRHMNAHCSPLGLETYACPTCGIKFPEEPYLLRHLKVHEGASVPPMSLRCPKCSNIYTTEKELQCHLHFHDSGSLYLCDECGKSYTQDSRLSRHIANQHSPVPVPCDKCHKTFINQVSLTRHQVAAHRPGQEWLHVCPNCGKSFALATNLAWHLTSHTNDSKKINDQESTCQRIDSQCQESECLVTECLVTECQNMDSMEPECQGKTECAFSPNNDMKALSDLLHEAYICPHCDQLFLTPHSLGLHLATHSEQKPFLCTVCSCTFLDKDALLHHEVTHQEQKIYQCQVCDEQFNQKSNLNVHMHKHMHTKKLYKCTQCYKAFLYRSQLQLHSIVHTGARPHVCSLCSKSYSNLTSLRKHENVHSNIRPQCTLCDKTFIYEASLKRHLFQHSGRKDFVCPNCSKAFTRKGNMQEHLKKCAENEQDN